MDRRLTGALTVLLLAASAAGAQSPLDPFRGTHALEPLEYHEEKVAAAREFDAGRYEQAASRYERVVEAYPWDGESWRLLGVSRLQLGQYDAAAEALIRADSLGITPYPQLNAVDAAVALMQAGRADRALDWLEKAVLVYRHDASVQVLRDSLFAPLRGTPRYERLLGRPEVIPTDRVAGWRLDIRYLLDAIERFRPEFAQGGALPDSIRQMADRIGAAVPSLTDAQLAVELRKLLATLGGSHTGIGLHPIQVGHRIDAGALPLGFRFFPDGVYIVSADSARQHLLAARVVAIDGTPIDSVLRALESIVQSSEGIEFMMFATQFLEYPYVLQALRVALRSDQVGLRVLDRTGAILDETVAAVRSQGARVHVTALSDRPLPLYMTRESEPQWFTIVPGTRTMYVHLSRMLPPRDGPSLAEFGLALRHAVDTSDIANVVVDVRNNPGGNTYLYPEILRTLIAFDTRDNTQLYVIPGRITGSAAMNFALDLDRLTDAIFVGEPTGAQPHLQGDPVAFGLPYSGLVTLLSTVEWRLTSPRDTRRVIVPDIPVPVTAEDYFGNRDPVLEVILEHAGEDPAALNRAAT